MLSGGGEEDECEREGEREKTIKNGLAGATVAFKYESPL
jgi:hypothetical protein